MDKKLQNRMSKLKADAKEQSARTAATIIQQISEAKKSLKDNDGYTKK